MNKALEGRAVIITGAGKSIGRAMALCLASLGARVLVNNRSHAGEAHSSAERVCEEIRAAGGEAVANLDSVEQEGSAERMVEQALDAFGRLDVVVHNAAIAPEKRISGLTMDSLRQTFDINYFAPAALTRAALPALRESGSGRLVYVISNGGLYGGDGLCAYASTKAALYAHMRCAATEGARYGITANALAPFAVSQMTDAAMQDPALREALDPGWIGPVCAVLASASFRESGRVYVTGGGRIREARVEETDFVRFPSPDAQSVTGAADALQRLAAMPVEAGYENAMQAFGETMRGITGKRS
jgi:NAD(P)-dependent dehydrogenase (short-subunit alcohol dehydrogenase family)